MRFVPAKSVEQRAVLALHRVCFYTWLYHHEISGKPLQTRYKCDEATAREHYGELLIGPVEWPAEERRVLTEAEIQVPGPLDCRTETADGICRHPTSIFYRLCRLHIRQS